MDKRGRIKIFILLGIFVLSIIFISLFVTGENMPSANTNTNANNQQQISKENNQENSDNKNLDTTSNSGITGGVIGTLLSGKQIVYLAIILAVMFIVLIICQTILKIKKNH